MADPPWFYNSRTTLGDHKDTTKFGGGAAKHYPLMKDAELLALAPEIDKLCEKNCCLFLWATMPRLDFAIELLKAWGFKYKTTAFVWVKPTLKGDAWNNGPGFYTGSNTEVVLLGKRGMGMQPERKMLDSVILASPTNHSAKPAQVRYAIDIMYPGKKKLELFARHKHPGWDSHGNEISGSVKLEV